MALPASFKSLGVMFSGPVDLLVFRALTLFVLSVARSQAPKSGVLIPIFVVFTIWADCGTLSMDGSAAASFSPIVEKI